MDFHGGSTTVYHPYLSRLSLPWYIASSWFNMDADRLLPNHGRADISKPTRMHDAWQNFEKTKGKR